MIIQKFRSHDMSMNQSLVRWYSIAKFAAIALIAPIALAGLSATPIFAQESDAPLEYIEPVNKAVNVGYAGDAPADIARFLLARGAGAIALSPDGSRIALRLSITGKPQLWILDIAGDERQAQPKQLTFGNGITFFRWHPDGQTLIYGADNDGNEQESYIEISADGSAERAVLAASKGGFRRFGAFNGDGSKFAFASTQRNGLDFDIYTADTKTGDTSLMYEGKFGFFVEAVSPSGDQMILSETVGEDSDNLYLFHSDKKSLIPLSLPTPRANHTASNVIWSDDAKSLIFATNRDTEFRTIVKFDLASRAMTPLYQGDHDAEDITVCGKNRDALVFSVNLDGFSELRAIKLSSGKAIALPELPDGVIQVDCAHGSDQVAARVSAHNIPGDVYSWSLGKTRAKRVFASNMAGLNAASLIKPVSITMRARDGVELQGLLYMPTITAGEKPPVVFDIHGGPTAQSRPRFDGPVQYLVGRGIAVFQPNVRGSTGFGRTYVTLDDRRKRLDSVRDLIDMLAHLKIDGRVDTGRAAVLGGSYGGYMVNAVLAAYPDAFIAGVSLYGVADWVTALEVASPALKAADRIEYGDITEPEWRAFYTEQSPIRQVDQIRVPVLFSHGVMDPRIDIAETETMVRALRARGIDAPFIRIPDEGHGWRKLSNRLFYYRQEAEFLEDKLGLTPGVAQ